MNKKKPLSKTIHIRKLFEVICDFRRNILRLTLPVKSR